MDLIRLTGMQFHGHHGVYAPERELGQRFVVHATLFADLRAAGQSDDIGQAVNYADVYEAVRTIVEGPAVNLLECLAERLAAHLLDRYAALSAIEIDVEKPGAALPGVFDSVGVRIRRHRRDKR